MFLFALNREILPDNEYFRGIDFSRLTTGHVLVMMYVYNAYEFMGDDWLGFHSPKQGDLLVDGKTAFVVGENFTINEKGKLEGVYVPAKVLKDEPIKLSESVRNKFDV